MRGKATCPHAPKAFPRITPAHAGKRERGCKNGTDFQDHPRTCGEKIYTNLGEFLDKGSPPHMRGKALEKAAVVESYGITPAHAGKSRRSCRPQGSGRDHPRTCGEKKVMRGSKDKHMGSPPHMRGKVPLILICGTEYGITPAHAGKRVFLAIHLYSIRDHPRTCGEKTKRSRSIVPHAAIVPLFPSVCNKPAGSDGSPAGHDAPPFLPIENAVPASPAYNLRSL